ncbi:DUF411 domain-containing protein [Psychrobacter sp.]|uniref:DUF411 domain-containing protein n=1 Tax=Psychrobacter sp. TaxID=56811 RepID=UPI003C70D72B
MTALKLKSSSVLNRHLSKGLHGAVVLLAVTSLFACSQSDSSVSDASATLEPTQNVAATSKTAEPNAKNIPMMTASVNSTDLLKNVSATVYKDPHCGCCKEWISHAEDNGLSATAHDVEDMSVVKERYSVPNEMQSCHTIVTADDYVFEGHVPAKYMAQFLENPPAQAIGLAVPGMPMGSPGMEHQNQFDPYQVMQLNKDGTTEVYANIDSVEQQI